MSAVEPGEILARVEALERRFAEMDRELGEEDDRDLGGAVLEDEERRKEAEDRETLVEALWRWHHERGDDGEELHRILDRHFGHVPRLSPAERAVVEVEACRRAASGFAIKESG